MTPNSALQLKVNKEKDLLRIEKIISAAFDFSELWKQFNLGKCQERKYSYSYFHYETEK